MLRVHAHVLRDNTHVLRNNTCVSRGSKHVLRNTIHLVRNKNHLLRDNTHVLKGSKQLLRDKKESFCSKNGRKQKKPMKKIHGLRYLHLLSDLLFDVSLDMRFFGAASHLVLVGVFAILGCHSCEHTFGEIS